MNYIVTGTDFNGCTDTDTVFVEINSLPVVSAGTDHSVCFKSLTTLNGSGADTYTWDNSVDDGIPFSPASSATYIVWGTDVNGCQASDTVMIAVEHVDVTVSLIGVTLAANQKVQSKLIFEKNPKHSASIQHRHKLLNIKLFRQHMRQSPTISFSLLMGNRHSWHSD